MNIKSSLAVFACTALALLTMPVKAEAELKHPIKPFLWKVEGKDLTVPSYLFGTLHISSGPASKLHPAAQKAFDESEVFYAEVPMDMKSQLASAAVMMRDDGKKLSESIGEDLVKQLDEELAAINPALDSKPFQTMKTWVMAVLPQILPIQLEGGVPLDAKLWNAADKAGKETAGLEDAVAQLKGFNELTEPEQIIYLRETLKMIKEDRDKGIDSIQRLVDVYLEGDSAKLALELEKGIKRMNESAHKELGVKLMKALLEDRDKIMADKMVEALTANPDKVHFFAAGALHYTPKTNVRTHLEKAGYTITRIEK